jgi:hypothetical protein
MRQPDGAAFDVVLLLHTGCAAVGVVTMVTAAATAAQLGRTLGGANEVPEALRRYFRPRFNWAGRSVYGIPVFGVALLAMSNGAYTFFEGWVLAGLVLFAAVVALGEGALWPAEQRIGSLMAAAGAGLAEGERTALRRDARLMARTATLALVLLLVGTVVMVAQP